MRLVVLAYQEIGYVCLEALLLAGADVLIMRHPEAIKLVREMIVDLTA